MRNSILDIIKLIGIIVICLHHTAWFTTLYHGYLPVEMFFIVSGYFIYKASEKGQSILTFLNKRIKRLYLPYCLALSIYIYLAWLKPELFGVFDLVPSIICSSLLFQNRMPELFGIHNSIGLCGPSWYLSVLFYGGLLLFVILRFTNRKFRILSLTIVLVCVYTQMLLTGKVEHFYNVGLFNLPFFRGIAGMSLGFVIASPYYKKYVSTNISNSFFRNRINLMSIIAMIVFLVIMCTPNNFPVLAIPCMFLILTGILSPGLWLNNLNSLPAFSRITIPDISLEMLLLHKVTIYPSVILCEKLGCLSNLTIKTGVFLGTTIISSFMLKKIVDIIVTAKYPRFELITRPKVK